VLSSRVIVCWKNSNSMKQSLKLRKAPLSAATLRAVNAKTEPIGNKSLIGERGLLQTQLGASLLERRKKNTGRRADCGKWLAGLLLCSQGRGSSRQRFTLAPSDQKVQFTVPSHEPACD